MPDKNPYEGATESQNRTYEELRITQEREEDRLRWRAASEAVELKKMNERTRAAERAQKPNKRTDVAERPTN